VTDPAARDYVDNLNALTAVDRDESNKERLLFHLCIACAERMSVQDFQDAITTAKRRLEAK
jgi:hypothetical protein